MSTIDPSTIDPTKPAQGLPLTANVRANEQATQDNFAAAKADIEALEAQPAGREIQNEGVPLADQTLSAINVQGNAISVTANVAQDRYDFTANNAVINQLGGGAELFIGDVGSDPVTRELRTIIGGTGATVTQTATEIIIDATGLGGGEVNSAENIGVGLPIALEVNNGTLIPIRSLDASLFEESAGVITVSAQTFADWTTAQGHYDNANIHFPVSSLPGDGLAQNGSALDVDASVARNPMTADLQSGGFHYVIDNGLGSDGGYLGLTSNAIALVGSTTLSAANPNIPIDIDGEAITVNSTLLRLLSSGSTFLRSDGPGSVNIQAAGTGDILLSAIGGDVNVTDGELQVDGQSVYSPSNPPPAGGGDVSSPGGTTVDAVQLGDTGATDIKDGPAESTLVRTDTTRTVGEIGIPWTVTDLTAQAGAPAPLHNGNAAYYTNHAGDIVVQLDASGPESPILLLVGTAVTNLAFNPAPSGQTGAFTAGKMCKVHIDRVSAQTFITIVSAD